MTFSDAEPGAYRWAGRPGHHMLKEPSSLRGAPMLCDTMVPMRQDPPPLLLLLSVLGSHCDPVSFKALNSQLLKRPLSGNREDKKVSFLLLITKYFSSFYNKIPGTFKRERVCLIHNLREQSIMVGSTWRQGRV